MTRNIIRKPRLNVPLDAFLEHAVVEDGDHWGQLSDPAVDPGARSHHEIHLAGSVLGNLEKDHRGLEDRVVEQAV